MEVGKKWKFYTQPRAVAIGHFDPPDWSANWSLGCLRDSYVASGMSDVTGQSATKPHKGGMLGHWTGH